MKANLKTILFLVLFTISGYGQINTIPVEVISPAPSVANLMSFTEVPVNTHTGIPDISIPLVSLSTHNKDIGVNVALSYHPSSISIDGSASDVGLGWNLTADGVISRAIYYTPDEYLIPTFQNNIPNFDLSRVHYDDVYSYNFMGYTGKFKITYNGHNNTFLLEKLQVDNLKIEFNMINGTQIIDSFIIYDDKGYKYIFDVKDKDKRYLNNLIIAPSLTSQHPLILSEEYLKMDYFFYSAHHLSKVTDNNGEELVTYLYEEFIEPDLVNPHSSTNLITNKLSQINAIDHGKIIFDFDKVLSPLQKDNDPIQLQNIEVKDNHNNTIKKYNFEYSGISLTIGVIDHRTKRILSKIIENNNDDTQNNEYKFKYINNVNNTNPFFCDENYYGLDPFGYLTSALNINNLVEDTEVDVDYLGDLNADFNRYRPSKDLVNFGVIEEITYPTGGRVKYEFESHTYSFNENQSNMFYDIPIQEVYKARNFDNHVYSELYNSNYDTSTLYSNSIPLNITGTSPVKLYFKLLSNPYYSNLNDPVNEPLYATCRLIGNGVDFYIDNYSVTCLGDYIEVQPGIYTIQFFSVGNEPATGHLKITKKETTTQPIKEWFYGGGLRIKKISHFNSLLVNAMPVNEINYDYQMFDNSNKSSGEMYDGYFRNFLSGLGTVTQVSYRNVKIFNSLNNGFIKHTYESYVDSPFYPSSPLYPNSGYYQNYFGFKNGLLKKTEYYNSSNVLLKKIENEYDFEERGDAMIISSMLYVGSIFSTKAVWAKLIATNITEYFLQSGNTETTLTGKTFSYNPLNLKNSENTITNSQGETLKTKYFYHRGNSIHSQNRISEIERVETYRGSELLSKSQIVYNNNWANNVSFLPQTIKTAKGNESYENRLHNLQYDEFSNPLEVQQEGGIHICYIWGYNKTQPIAKIENATYAEVQPHVANLQTLSDGNNEQNLITALNNLRTALPNALITTYTYKPLVGISTVTDPKGDKQTYHYDSFNRLEFVKDAQGNILSENQYHYRTQN